MDPSKRLMDEGDMEAIDRYARVLLTQPDELANAHVARLAESVRLFYRHIVALKELGHEQDLTGVR